MAQTLLEICTESLEEIGIDPPTSIVNGGDEGMQLKAIANSVGRDLVKRLRWQDLIVEASFTTVATENQFTLKTAYPYLRLIIPNTSWNTTQQRPVVGPLSPQAWRRIQAENDTFDYPVFRIYQGNYYLLDPTAGETVYFEYLDKRWIVSSDGNNFYERFQADTDEPRLDDHAMVLGVRWRYLQKKGLEYGEVFREYEDWVQELMGADLPRETLNMHPGITRGAVGDGDWIFSINGLTWNSGALIWE